MRKVGNMRVPESTHKTREQLEFEKNQREGMLQYLTYMEDQYEKGKKGIAELESDENMPEEKKTHTKEGEAVVFALMCHKEGEEPLDKWYPIGYSYDKQPIVQGYVFIQEMNKMVEPHYEAKIVGIRESDFKAGYGGSYTEPKKEQERTAPTDEEIKEVKPDSNPQAELESPKVEESKDN